MLYIFVVGLWDQLIKIPVKLRKRIKLSLTMFLVADSDLQLGEMKKTARDFITVEKYAL